jgi:hypothetical protein
VIQRRVGALVEGEHGEQSVRERSFRPSTVFAKLNSTGDTGLEPVDGIEVALLGSEPSGGEAAYLSCQRAIYVRAGFKPGKEGKGGFAVVLIAEDDLG